MLIQDISFQEILDREQLILTDSSLQFLGSSDWYEDEVYKARRFSQLNQRILSDVITSLEERIWWWSHPKVHTTTRVVDDGRRFLYVIRDKLTALNEYEMSSLPPRMRDYHHRHIALDGNEGKRLMERVGFLYKEIIRISAKSIFKPVHQKELRVLENIVETIAEYTMAKIDFRYRYEDWDTKYEDLHADEQIVATALYLSLFDRTSNCIVTGDSDIQRILVNTLNYFGNTKMTGALKILRVIIENPIRVYFEDDSSKPRCDFDTSETETNTRNNGSIYTRRISEDVDRYLRCEIATHLTPHIT